MAVDYDWLIHVYVPSLERWICLKRFRFEYRCRSNQCYFEWDYTDFPKDSIHFLAPIEFQLEEGNVIVNALDANGRVSFNGNNSDETDSIWFDLNNFGTFLYDVNDVECFDKPFISKDEIPLHYADGEELGQEDYEENPDYQCFVCRGIAQVFVAARKLQYIPPALIYRNEYNLDDVCKKQRHESYQAYLDVFLARLLPKDIRAEVKNFLEPTINMVRVQQYISV